MFRVSGTILIPGWAGFSFFLFFFPRGSSTRVSRGERFARGRKVRRGGGEARERWTAILLLPLPQVPL